MPVGLASVFLLNPAGVGKHQLAQVRRAGGADHAAAKTLCHESRQIADVIEVRMGEHDGINRGRRDRKLLPVSKTQLFQALKEPTIEEYAAPVVLEEVLGPRHRPRRTEKRQLCHGETQ